VTHDAAHPSADEARALLAAPRPVLRISRRDRALVAAGIAAPSIALAAMEVWGLRHVDDDRWFLPLWIAFGVVLVVFSFVRTHTRAAPYDSRRQALLAATLTLPAIVVGLVVAHLPWGPAIPYEVSGFLLIAAPAVVVAGRVLRDGRA
jgi:hypothetical protein